MTLRGGGERFGLFWPGKTQAIRAAQTPTTATLQPDPDNSVDWDTTQNVVIEGDNLEVLKVLQKHYYGKIKMIYIDPPYNTGGDFVYRDDYADPIGRYLDLTGQRDGGGKLSTNTELAGRFHSNWLNMMYPRLKLARNLLSPEGVVAISIDSHELHHLLALCNEIFGEQNVLAALSVVNNLKGRSDDEYFATSNEYCVICSRNVLGARIDGLPAGDEYFAQFKEHDEISAYKRVPLRKTGKNSRREDRPNMYYPIYYHVETNEISLAPPNPASWIQILPLDSSGREGRWRWSQETTSNKLATELQACNVNGSWQLYVKMRSHVDGIPRTVRPKTTWIDPKYDSGSAKQGLKKLFDGNSPFDTPKSIKFLEDLMRVVSLQDSDFILDFFAGSGTTAHAVMALNAEDGGNRRCISVQLPEPTGEKSEARKAGYSTISEITRERIRRAGKKILEEEAAKLDGRGEALDVGFRAYKLVDTNFTKWRADSSLSEDELTDLFSNMGESADDDARPEALLTEVLLKLGFSLTEQVEHIDVAGLGAFSVADGLLVAYLNEHVKPTLEQLRALVTLEPGRLVVLEDAFEGDDELKTNLVQECRSRGVDLWTA